MASSRRPYREALRQRDFRTLAVSALIDQVGSWSYSVVLAVVVFDRTHSTTWLAGLSATRWITGLVLSGYAGVVADRYERTRVMVLSASASGVVMAGIAVAVGVKAPVWTLVPLIACSGVASSPYQPAAGALTPEVVPESTLAAANAFFAAIENVVVVLGPAIGGLVLVIGSPTVGVAINAASFFVAAALASRLGVTSRGVVERGAGLLTQSLVGLRAIFANRAALALVVFCALDSAVYGASTVIYAPLSERLGTGVNGYSYLLAGGALGGVLAAGLASRLSALRRLAPVIGVSLALQALPFAVTVWAHSATPAFVLQVVSGVGMVVVDVLAVTALQRDLDKGSLSRVLGGFDAIITAATLVGSFVLAAVMAASGIVAALLVIGLGATGLAVLGLPLLVRADRMTAAATAQLQERVAVLDRLDLFDGASRPVLERLAMNADERRLPAGDELIREGEPADALWVLVEGSLAVQATAGRGQQRELPPVTAPGYVGEIGLVRGIPRTATVSVSEPSVLLRIDGAEFLAALEAAPPSTSFVQLTGTRWARTLPRRGGRNRA